MLRNQAKAQNKIEQKLEGLTSNFNGKYSRRLERVYENSQRLREACDKLEGSWSGSSIGYHSKLYYGDFEKPPTQDRFNVEWGGINGFSSKWRERNLEEIKAKLNEIIGDPFDIDKFEKEIGQLGSEVEDLQSKVDIILSPFIAKAERGNFALLEKFELKKQLSVYLNSIMNHSYISRDSEAMAEGIKIPAVGYYHAVAFEAERLVEFSKKLLKMVDNFIIWCSLESISIKEARIAVKTFGLADFHQEIREKCQRLFGNGEYAEAVEMGFKVVRDKLRDLTGHEKGSEAFGKGGLHIEGAAAPNVDKDFNEGVKFLIMAIDFFKNEKSHTAKAKIDSQRQALEFLALSSLAMNLLDGATIRKRQKSDVSSQVD